jgi:hypothetical protein
MESIIVKMMRNKSKPTIGKFLRAILALIVLPIVLLFMWVWHGLYLVYRKLKSFLTRN